tara:strand:+ start:247 stop:528 length:282 start_codon:yes stop_codon:yes gene_type:complete
MELQEALEVVEEYIELLVEVNVEKLVIHHQLVLLKEIQVVKEVMRVQLTLQEAVVAEQVVPEVLLQLVVDHYLQLLEAQEAQVWEQELIQLLQ